MPISSWWRGRNTPATPPAAQDGLDYPTGAHYLPLPSRESTHVREMLADFGLIERDAGGDTPYYDETALVHSPQERLLRDGRWEDSLLPMQGLPEADLAQHRRFLAQVQALHTRRGNDGRKVFAIPLTLSSRDPAWTALDGITFRQWLEREGYTSPALRWYLDYCCRDDYGADTGAVSAWAGLHYFAARDGHAANAAEGAVLTWPGGLSTLVARMRAAISARLGHERWLLPGTAARIRETPAGPRIACVTDDGGAYALQARRAVCAMPLFVAQRLLPDIRAYGYDRRCMLRRARPGWCRTSSWTAIRWKRPANRCPGTTWSTRARGWAMWSPRTSCCGWRGRRAACSPPTML